MGTYGRTVTDTAGRGVRASADGKPRYKAGGVTIDWTTVPANNADTTLPDGQVVPAGTKYIRFGAIVTQITATGKYGPAETGVVDGRQLVDATVRGKTFIVDETVTQADPGGDHPAVFDGGLVYFNRLQIGAGTFPTEANVETMFPAITFVY